MMRIIFKESTQELTCLEVTYCSYAVDVVYWDDRAEQRKTGSGFYFEGHEGSSWIVPNMTQIESDAVVREMFRTGCYDLSASINNWIPFREDDEEDDTDDE